MPSQPSGAWPLLCLTKQGVPRLVIAKEGARQRSPALRCMLAACAAQVELSTALFNACITACDKGGRWQFALQVLGDMPASRVDSDLITCNACLSACGKA